jgi:Zn-dependent protease/CBS domain-containing protein
MLGGPPLGTVVGVHVRVSYGWIVLVALCTATLAASWFDLAQPGVSAAAAISLGLLTSVLLFASVVAREAARAVMARYRGLRVSSVTLLIFGGVSNLDREPRGPGEEFQLALAGPLANFLIAALAGWLHEATLPLTDKAGIPAAGQNALLPAVFAALSVGNALLGLVNLLPGLPLDGGRVLRAVLWRRTSDFARATRMAAHAGQVCAFLLMLWGIAVLFSGNPTSGLWLVIAATFLLAAALQIALQSPLMANGPALLRAALDGVAVRAVMRPADATISPDLSLQKVVDDYILGRGMRVVPVLAKGRFAGLVALSDIRTVPREQWPKTPVSRALTPPENVALARPDQPAAELVPLLARAEIAAAPVVREGQLVGIVDRDALLTFLGARGPQPAQVPRPTPAATQEAKAEAKE